MCGSAVSSRAISQSTILTRVKLARSVFYAVR